MASKKTKSNGKQTGDQQKDGKFAPNNKLGNRFAKGQSGNPAGRAKKFITTLKSQGYKVSEVNDCIQVMLSMSKKQLSEAIQSEEATALEMMIGAAILKAIKTGSLATFEILASRSFGKPKETIEIQEGTPEIDAARALYHELIDEGKLTQRVALNRVVKSAKSRGFEIEKDLILNADTID